MDYTLYKAEDFAADESFINYHLGTDPAAVTFWESWISHHPEMLDEILTAEHLIDMLYVGLSKNELEEEQNRLLTFLDDKVLEDTLPNAVEEPKRAKYNTRRWVTAVLVCMGLALVLLWVWNYKTQTKEPIEWLSSANPAGKRSTIQLSDGTTVTLNANSTLFYPKAFRGKTRELMLTGEAYFEVARNPEKPFVVRTGKLTTTVLGTKFNVRAIPGSQRTQVALLEGSVRVEATSLAGQTILHPKQQVTYSEKENSLTTSTFAAEEVLAWKSNTLIFRDATFKEVADKLYQAYGITLQNHSSKQNWSYSGKFENRDYLTVIRSICYAKRLTYTVKQDTVIIK